MQKQPVTRTPEQILDAAILQPRPLLVDANVVAYFGDLLMGMKKAIRNVAAAANSRSSVRTAPKDSASSQHRS